ncbi:MAG TPA: LD-carboxypeptidase [Waddliaceae bacterium]
MYSFMELKDPGLKAGVSPNLMKNTFLFLTSILISISSAAATPIAPPTLHKGDTIAIVAPSSSPDEDPTFLARGIKELQQKGYKVKVSANLTKKHGYLAGTDEERAKSIMEAWRDPQVKAIWCYRGGYGVSRILDRLDYQVMKDNPKILIGMSDITALHAAIQKKAGLITFLGPNTNAILGKEDGKSTLFNEKELWSMISRNSFPKEGILFRNPQSFPNRIQQSWALKPGRAQGRLAGGNLCLVVALIGTPWELDLKGKILVLEEIDEEPYRIDRMLSQLRHSGHLDHLAGVILCSWTGCFSRKPDKSLTLEQVFNDYFGKAPYPVLVGFPSGHIAEQTTLPLNSLVELDSTAKTLRLLESPVNIL